MTSTGLPVRFDAVVLAGGSSSRMGRDKAFLPWNGTSLLSHQLATLSRLGPEELLISGRAGVVYPMDQVRVVSDEYSDGGPMVGLWSVLRVTASPYLVVVAVDMPYVTVELLRQMLEMADGGHAVAPRVGNRWEPLVAVYPRGITALIKEELSTSRSMQVVLNRAYETGLARPLSVSPTNSLTSLNSPLDLHAAKARTA